MEPRGAAASKQASDIPDFNESENSDLAKLRALLLGVEQEKALQELLYHGDTHKVSKVLSEAIIQRNSSDGSIAQALAPVLDDAFNTSITRNPQKITNVIYPVIGPSIRKAVARSLADLVQSLNTVLENSLSLRAWGWRFKAWRAGMGYAEFVLLQTLDFRVEQVLLIHRHTGLLLHSESIPGTTTEDPDLVSSMLAAINDFVNDSFNRHQPSSIDNVRVGDFLLEIETSPTAMLVAVVRGTPSDEITENLKNALERIHLVFNQQMLDFNGDMSVFASAAEILQPCLIQKNKKPQKKSFPWLASILLLTTLSALTYFGYLRYQTEREKDRILSYLRATPGYIVINERASSSDRTIDVDVLRSPISLPPSELNELKSAEWRTFVNDRIAALDLQSYLLTMLPDLLQTKANFSLASGVLTVSGQVHADEYQRLKNSSLLANHFPDRDFENLSTNPPPPKPSDIEIFIGEWNELKTAVESTNIKFIPNQALLSVGEEDKLPGLVGTLNKFKKAASNLDGLKWQLLITGYADNTGTTAINLSLSKERAELVKEMLTTNGITEDLVVAFGAGHVTGVNLPGEAQRVVSLQIIHTELPTK